MDACGRRWPLVGSRGQLFQSLPLILLPLPILFLRRETERGTQGDRSGQAGGQAGRRSAGWQEVTRGTPICAVIDVSHPSSQGNNIIEMLNKTVRSNPATKKNLQKPKKNSVISYHNDSRILLQTLMAEQPFKNLVAPLFKAHNLPSQKRNNEPQLLGREKYLGDKTGFPQRVPGSTLSTNPLTRNETQQREERSARREICAQCSLGAWDGGAHQPPGQGRVR